jgi:hypothetical protein
MRWRPGAIAATLLGLTLLCSCQITAPSGASPQYGEMMAMRQQQQQQQQQQQTTPS